MNDIKSIIDDIKNRVDIIDIISEYINVERRGESFKALCPFHNEKTPSFHISSQKQIYKCFGCGEGGDAISFIMKMENMEFLEAVKFLANKYGIEFNSNMSEKNKKILEKTKKYIDINTESARFYFKNLFSTRNNAYEYLRKRGLDDKTIKKFGLGYSFDSFNSLKNFLISKGYDINELIECGLISKKEEKTYDKFRNRIMFPIFDYRGNVIGFGGRVLDNSNPKYLNSPESIVFNKSENLYGINFCKKEIKNKTVILVEGYMDLISLFQYGIKNVLASLGTSLTKGQAQLIRRYADTVIISYDKDDAGIKATLRAIDILINFGINVRVLDLESSKDPDEFIRKYGVLEFNKKIKESSHYIKYKIDLLYKKYNILNDDEKIKFLGEAISLIKTLKNHIEIDFYSNYLSKISKTNIESIKMEIYNYNKNIQNNPNKNYKINKTNKEKFEKIKITKKIVFVEENLIKIILENTNHRNLILSQIQEKDLLLYESKEILKYIIKNKELDKITIDKLKSLNIHEEYISDLEKIIINDIDNLDANYIQDVINNTKKNTINQKINNYQKELSINENKKEVHEKVMQIVTEIRNLKKELESFNK